MASPIVAIRGLHFSYPQSAEPLFDDVTAVFPRGFTAVVGVNGSGKSTFLKLLAGKLRPDRGVFEGASSVVNCAQRTDHAPDNLAALLNDWEPAAFELRGRLDVPDDAQQRWDSLSHGERKRVQIACALWQSPDVLLIDEPTNHIDENAKALLESALQRFAGVGVIVSHDRELLDSLCAQTLWLQPPTVVTYSGGYSAAQSQRTQNQLSNQRQRDRLQADQRKLQTEVLRRRDRASRANADRSKRGIAAKDSDARDRIDRARVTGKDGTAGKLLRQLDGRVAQTSDALSALSFDKEYDSGIWVAGVASKANALFQTSEGQLALGGERWLLHPELLMRPTDRIAITGANGAGKSTLVASILANVSVPPERLVVMPQEVTAVHSAEVLEQVRALPRDDLGRVMSIVSRLGSRPAQLLESVEPSPGELRKLLLALGIMREPYLLVLDEPTNHLDVLAIESLEDALAQCPCGLLIVSHDRRLVERLTTVNWKIRRESNGDSLLEL